MQGFAIVVLAGNLTRDPEMKYLPSGTPVCEFGMAINEKWNDNGEKKERVSFLDVKCFGKTAETAAQYLSKGKPVSIEGKLQQERWETDRQEKRSKIIVVGNRIHFLPDGKGPGGEGADEQA
jgi:single-strand DNA-binding protein